MTETELLRLTLMSGETVSDPSLWPVFLKSYAAAAGAAMAALQVHDLSKRSSEIKAVFGMSSPFSQSYNQYYSKLNVWRDHGRQKYVAGKVVVGEEQCPTSLLRRSEFYNDYLAPMDGVYSMAAVIALNENRAVVLTSLRGRRQSAFEEREERLAQFLLPHLSRAHAMSRRLELLEAGESMLDALPLGVVFLSADGCVLYCNSAAEETFRSVDGLAMTGGRLTAVEPRAHAELRNAVQHALAPGRSIECPWAALVPRPSLRRSYCVMVAPLSSRSRRTGSTSTPAAVAVITDPELRQPAVTELLRQLYELTPKETALTERLAAGATVEQAAGDLGMRYETARTHLRRIFDKTGTCRQTELAILVARLPRLIPRK